MEMVILINISSFSFVQGMMSGFIPGMAGAAQNGMGFANQGLNSAQNMASSTAQNAMAQAQKAQEGGMNLLQGLIPSSFFSSI